MNFNRSLGKKPSHWKSDKNIILLSWHNTSISIGYRAHIFDTKKFCFIKRHKFLMQKMKNLNFVKTMLDITTKIQHKVGFVITHSIAGFNSFWNEVYFWQDSLHDHAGYFIRSNCLLCTATKPKSIAFFLFSRLHFFSFFWVISNFWQI